VVGGDPINPFFLVMWEGAPKTMLNLQEPVQGKPYKDPSGIGLMHYLPTQILCLFCMENEALCTQKYATDSNESSSETFTGVKCDRSNLAQVQVLPDPNTVTLTGSVPESSFKRRFGKEDCTKSNNQIL